MFGVVSAFLSAMAAVYTEWVMKRNNDSLYWQNIQLYTFGVAFNALGLVLGDLRAGDVLLLLAVLTLVLNMPCGWTPAACRHCKFADYRLSIHTSKV